MTIKDKRRRNKTKRFFRLYAGVTGEMSVEDIPASPSVDLEALKSGDDDPLEVVVEIPVGKSKRGWNYTESAIDDIVRHVNEHTLNADLGHQKPEDVSNEFRAPVTHWIGAKRIADKAYFRGVVDASAKDLKRWIRAGRVKQVSIFGQPQLQKTSGETHVVGYKPLSIDWTPLDRMGMPTRIVAIGEMEEVQMESNEGKGDERPMNPEELLQALTEAYQNKQITPTMLQKSLGIDAVQLAGEMDSTIIEKHNTLTEVAKTLGVAGEMDVVEVAKQAKQALDQQEDFKFEQAVGEMAEQKIQSEAVRRELLDEKTPIGKMWAFHAQQINKKDGTDVIAGEMDKFLEDAAVKTLIQSHSVGGNIANPVTPGSQASTTTRRRRVSIY